MKSLYEIGKLLERERSNASTTKYLHNFCYNLLHDKL